MIGKQLQSDDDTIHRISSKGCSLSANIDKTVKEPEQLSSISILNNVNEFRSLLLCGKFSSVSTLTIKYSGISILEIVQCLSAFCLPKLEHLIFEGNVISGKSNEFDLLFQYDNFPVLIDILMKKSTVDNQQPSDKPLVDNLQDSITNVDNPANTVYL